MTMPLWARRACAVGCTLAGTASAIHGAGLRNLEDGWLLHPLEMQDLLDERGDVPAAGHGGRIWLSGGAMQLFGLPELPVQRVAAGATVPGGAVTLHVAASRENTGTGLVTEAWSGAAVHVGAESGLGVEFRRGELTVAGRPAGRALLWRLVLRGRWQRAPLSLRWSYRHPLDRAPGWYGAGALQPVARLAVLVSGPGLGAAVGAARRGDDSLVLSHEVSVALGGRVAVGLRFDPATGSLGPVTLWRTGRVSIRTGHVTHPELGITHRCQVILGVPGVPAP